MRKLWKSWTEQYSEGMQKSAIFNSKTFVAKLEDKEGELLSFIVTVDYKICSEGLEVVKYEYWPPNPDLKDSVEDFIYSQFS